MAEDGGPGETRFAHMLATHYRSLSACQCESEPSTVRKRASAIDGVTE